MILRFFCTLEIVVLSCGTLVLLVKHWFKKMDERLTAERERFIQKVLADFDADAANNFVKCTEEIRTLTYADVGSPGSRVTIHKFLGTKRYHIRSGGGICLDFAKALMEALKLKGYEGEMALIYKVPPASTRRYESLGPEGFLPSYRDPF